MEEQVKKIKISDPDIALTKAEKFCAYQERCQQELRDKLYEWGMWPEAVENIIVSLIESDFLNEERFAIAYARGKFRIKQWGKNKIKQALKFKKVSDYCIKKGLSEISADDYMATIKVVIQKQEIKIKESNPLKKKFKIAQYLVGRGFEQDLVWDVLNGE